MATQVDDASDKPESSFSYLALGDSYTIGESVKEKSRWPNQLVQQLAKQGLHVARTEIIAKTGWTTDELNAAMDRANPESGRDLVTLLIGVNNQYRGRVVAEYKPEFEDLLLRAIALAEGKPERVIVVSIPDYGLTPFIANKPDRDPKVIASELDAYNLAAKEITLAAKAHWVDITGASRKQGNNKKMYADDGLHPSAKMYALWVREVLPVAEAILTESNGKSAGRRLKE